MNLLTSSQAAHDSVAEKTKRELIRSLFANSLRVFVSHAFISFIYAYWIMTPLNQDALFIWLIGMMLISTMRCAVSYFYYQHADRELNPRPWVFIWSMLSLALSLCYAFTFVVLTPVDANEYLVGIAAVSFVLCGGAAVSYASNIYAALTLILPVVLFSSGYMIYLGQETSYIIAAAMLSYALSMYLLVKPVNKAFVQSIELNFRHQKELDKRKLLEQQLYDISRRDSLTGLFNRRYFDEMLEVELGRAYRHHTALSLILLDVDHFKEYNDHYGHVAGDNCLLEVAQLIERQANRKGDLVSRYGGEEFAIILPGIDGTGALAFAQRLQTYIQEQAIEHQSTKLTSLKCITISVGVTTVIPLMKIKPNKLIEQADKALYEAKRDGRNRVKAFAPFGIDHGLI